MFRVFFGRKDEREREEEDPPMLLSLHRCEWIVMFSGCAKQIGTRLELLFISCLAAFVAVVGCVTILSGLRLSSLRFATRRTRRER